MKLTILVTGVAAALAISVLLPVGSSAQQVKGAQLLSPAAPAATTTPAAVMSCAKCQADFSTRTDVSARGANKPIVLAAQHSCCDTTVKTVGIGKAARTVASHSCSMGAEAACCR